jgi:NAD(P)-dependent dehydrogenase (short-subunit alcohol dehydrogenase family)
MEMFLGGRLALVTGAAPGTGSGIALAEAGHG